MTKRGPYVNEDMNQVGYPASDWTYAEARKAAASYVRETISWEWGRSKFIGKRDWTGHDCDAVFTSDANKELVYEVVCTCQPEPMYLFETYDAC
jgi:hypothetical protein